MSGVYNRKLFRQGPARDELRKLGGIMSSSEELMAEALRTADQAPRPAGLGTMALPMQQPMMQQPMPMQQPMGMMPPQPMGIMPPQQMPMEAQPLPQMTPQPMQEEPAYMPPQVPGSVQPQGFAAGGMAMGYSLKSEQDTADAEAEAAAADPTLSATPAEAIEANVLDKAQGLLPLLDTEDPEVIAAEILSSAAAQGVEPTGDTQVDLARIYQNLTGDPAAFEKNIDNLNRGIIGAAIGAGTSARATENISRGLLVGLEGAKATEERRLADTRALQLAEIQARTAEAKRKSGEDGTGFAVAEPPTDVFYQTYEGIMGSDINTLDIPYAMNEATGKEEPTMSQMEYADLAAAAAVARSFSPEQLVGTQFEGIHDRLTSQGISVTAGGASGPAVSAPAASSAAPGEYSATQQAMIEAATRKLRDGTTTPAKVAEVFSNNGITIDPAALQ